MLAEYELNRERNEELFVSAGKDNVCPVHFHRKVEVMYVTSGVKNFVAAGKETSLAADGIFFANSYEMHGYTESEGSTRKEAANGQFRCVKVRKLTELPRYVKGKWEN